MACREEKPQSALVRFVLPPASQTPCVDYLQKLPGKGVYLCPTSACFQKGTAKGGLRKGFRQAVNASYEELMTAAWDASRRQLASLFSLASRAGYVIVGHSRVEQALREQEGVLLLIASNTSEGVRRKFEAWAERLQMTVQTMLDKEEFGDVCGAQQTSLALITDAGFASTIRQEVQRSLQLVNESCVSEKDA